MGVFTVSGALAGVNFGDINIDTWDAAGVGSQTATLWSITPAGQPTWNFTGIGLTYDVNGFPTGGTITFISVNTGSGTWNFNLTATPVSAADLVAAILADDEAAFLGLVFANNDTLTGTAFNDVLNGYAGNDSIRGGAGADDLQGGSGDDTIAGGLNTNTNPAFVDGNDTIDGGDGADVLRGGNGDDIITGGSGVDNLRGDYGNDTLNGGSGDDIAAWRFDQAGLVAGVTFSAAAIDGSLTVNISDGLGGTDTLISIERAVITGTEFDDFLTGSSGIDQITGYNGNNTLFGGAGADTFFDNAGGDSIISGDLGDDRIVLYDNDHTYLNNGAAPYYAVGISHDVIDGGAGLDTAVVRWSLYNTSAVTIVMTGDVLSASTADGNLTISGISIERVEGLGGAGNDSMTGGAGNDEFYGNAGTDTLSGAGGADTLLGFDGADVLIGGDGNDILTGGNDADVFMFNAGTFGADTVTDFANGVDQIQFTAASGVDEFSDISVSTNGSGWALLTLPDGSTITLTGVTAGLVDSSDFIFGG